MSENVNFPPYALADIEPSTSPFEGFGLLGDICTTAHAHGVVSFGARDPQVGDTSVLDPFRLRTAALRLYLLGYKRTKPKDSKPATSILTPNFKTYVGQFQHEAGLPVTQLLDEKTWYALDTLVGFETELTADQIRKHWVAPQTGTICMALQRAIHVRLHVLGLAKKKPKFKTYEGLDPRSLQKLAQLNQTFAFSGQTLVFDHFDPATIAVLFNQDLLIEKVSAFAKGRPTFGIQELAGVDQKGKNLIRAFLVNLAKIELWLLGFRISPDGKRDYYVDDRVTPHAKLDTSLGDALEAFWKTLGRKTKHQAKELAKHVEPSFFQKLQEATVKAHTANHPNKDFSQEIADLFPSQNKLHKAWTYLKGAGSRLWDGLKRLWRWVKRGVTRIVKGITRIAENLYRSFFRYASKAFKILRIAITSSVQGIRYLIGPGLASKPPGKAYFRKQADMDGILIFSDQATQTDIKRFSARLHLKTSVFALGMKIITFVFHTIKHVAMGFVGWARFLLSLVRSLRALKPLYEQLKHDTQALRALEA